MRRSGDGLWAIFFPSTNPLPSIRPQNRVLLIVQSRSLFLSFFFKSGRGRVLLSSRKNTTKITNFYAFIRFNAEILRLSSQRWNLPQLWIVKSRPLVRMIGFESFKIFSSKIEKDVLFSKYISKIKSVQRYAFFVCYSLSRMWQSNLK